MTNKEKPSGKPEGFSLLVVAVLILLVLLILLVVLVVVVVLVVLVLLIILLLILILFVHLTLPPVTFAVIRDGSLPKLSGFILCFEKNTCNESCNNCSSNATCNSFQTAG